MLVYVDSGVVLGSLSLLSPIKKIHSQSRIEYVT